ncbi:MAG: von Willebrand factor type A domain-containing protein [Planctomycetota bacterium]
MNETKTMEFDADDPRLTAYALGELEGEERVELERLLERDARARAFVDELRATAGELEQGLAREPKLELSDAQRAAIAERAAPKRMRAPRWVWLSAAAGVLALSGLAYVATLRMQQGVEVASGGFDSWNRRANPGTPSDPASSRPASGGADALKGLGYVGSETTTVAVPSGTANSLSVPRDTLSAQPEAELGEVLVTHSGSGLAAGAKAKSRRRGDVELLRQVAGRAQDFETAAADDRPAQDRDGNTEAYAPIVENPFKLAAQEPLSTFSADVDTASYANVRRYLNSGTLPPPDAVRVEELLNYFRYEYPKPDGEAPFSVTTRVASCPWAPTHQLVQIGLRGEEIDVAKRQPSNLVFLIDVSGSMDQPDKLPLLVRSMKLLVEQLDGRDRIAMVVYAGASGVVLPSTTCDYKSVIVNALDALQAGGSTNGAAGIELAYQIAQANFTQEGQNRVILCTDGDFNVGVTDDGSLVRMIEEKRKSGVFLSVLGFGTGNTKDAKMELLADKGNGNYAYIDTLNEARKVLVSEMGGTLVTIAKDVKLQLEFNPAEVQAWRLIGYENRVLAHQDFNDDTKDAGEIGAGHTVTALYEIVPVGVPFQVPGVDPLKYQATTSPTAAARSGELLNVKLRYKAPNGDTSRLLETPVHTTNASWQEAHPDFKWASAVAGFGLVLRKSANVGAFGLKDALNLAVQGVGEDVGGYRKEFVELVQKARAFEAASEEKPRVR